MKTLTVLGRSALLAATMAILAATAHAAKEGRAEHKASAAMQERMQEMARDLNLSDAQKEQLKPILKAQMEKLGELRQDQSLSRADKLKRLQAIREESLPQVKAILTPEQFEKWQKKQAEGREHLRERVREKRNQ